MTVTADLDTWTTAVGTAMGLSATRDPDMVFPPCVYVGAPDALTVTVGELLALDIPVYLVADGHGGKVANDWLLDTLPAFLSAVGQRTAQPEPVTVDGVDHPAYRATARLHITVDAPPPPPPAVAPDLAVDNYGGGFVRIQYLSLLDDEAQHDGLTLGLAPTPAVNGELIPDLNALEALHGDVWYDHNGTLGHVLTASGTNLGPTMLARYIREGRTVDARLDLTASPPVFHIVFAHLPPNP